MPVVRTDGRAYGHVITKFSRMGRLPHFLTHGAPQARLARQSSATKLWGSAHTRASRARGAPLKIKDSDITDKIEHASSNLKICIFFYHTMETSVTWHSYVVNV